MAKIQTDEFFCGHGVYLSIYYYIETKIICVFYFEKDN